MKRIFIALFLAAAPIANAATPVRTLPMSGGCTTEIIAPANGSATLWTSDYLGQTVVAFQSTTDVDVYMGFTDSVDTTNGFPFFNKGDSISIEINENISVYFYGNGASSGIAVLSCKQ